MKNKLLSLVALVSLLASCSSDDGGSNNAVDPIPKQALSVEEGKVALENNSIELLTEVEKFNDNTALEEIVELAEFLFPEEEASTSSNSFNSLAEKTIQNTSSVAKKDISINDFNTIQTLEVVIAPDDETLIEEYNTAKGIYNWNPETEEFDKTEEASDVIIYNIAYNGKNAIFTISDFDTNEFTSNDEEVITSLKTALNVDGIELFNQSYTASVDNGKFIPNSFSNTISLGGFSFSTSLGNTNNSEITQNTEIKIGDLSLFKVNFAVSGDLNDLDTNGDDTEKSTEQLLDTGNFTISFLDAELTASANDSNFNSDTDLTITEQIELLNSNTAIDLSIGGSTVATGQFYEDEEEVFIPIDGEGGDFSFEETIEIRKVVNLRFLFADGTTADFDTYFDGSFAETETKFDTVFELYETKFEKLYDSLFPADDEIELAPVEAPITDDEFLN